MSRTRDVDINASEEATDSFERLQLISFWVKIFDGYFR